MKIFLSDEEYHSRTDLSSTMLKAFSKSPAHLRAMLNAPKDTTDAMKFGSMFHGLLLEGKIPHILQNSDKRTKAYKEEIESLPPCSSVATLDEYNTLNAMFNAVHANGLVSSFFNGAEFEASYFNEILGVKCRAKIDILNGEYILDLKTTQDASFNSFSKEIFNYNYHLQLAFYSLVTAPDIGEKKLGIIAVEKKPPFASNLFTLSQETVEYAKGVTEILISRYKDCLAKNEWPISGDNYSTVSCFEVQIPAWLRC